MSRRDTVLLAVIVNAAVLSLLFVFAKSPTDREEAVSVPVYESISDLNVVEEKPLAVNRVNEEEQARGEQSDVDIIIQDYVASIQPEPTREKVASQRIQPVQVEEDPFANVPMIEVTVEPGDVLGKIAKHYQTTISDIKKANKLKSDRLRVGQVIKVPVGSKEDAKQTTQVFFKPPAFEEEFYVIQTGDNPWKIAKKFHVSVFELLRLNGLDESKAKNLRPGDRIRVR